MLTSPALGDPASADFAIALNRRLVLDEDSYVNRAQGYVNELTGVAEQCAASAREYGHTDEQIAWMQEGPGSIVLTGAQSALSELGGALIESEAALRDQVSRLGAPPGVHVRRRDQHRIHRCAANASRSRLHRRPPRRGHPSPC